MTTLDPLGIVGTRVNERFWIEAVAGAGGFGIVYRAFDEVAHRAIAMKCLLPRRQAQGHVALLLRERFLQEARLHGHLADGAAAFVRSYGTGTIATQLGEIPYIALELLEGYPLGRELRERRRAGLTGAALGTVMARLDGVAQALAFAHAHGVAHRDLKPDNLFVVAGAAGADIKVLDLGSAKVAVSSVGAAPSSNMRLVTLGYAAPEQLESARGPSGPWTDVYSFALLLLEMVTDQRARSRSDPAASLRASSAPTCARCGAALPPGVRAAVDRGLELDPRRRTRDLGLFWGEVKHAAVEAGAFDVAPAPAPSGVRSLSCSLDEHDTTTRLDLPIDVDAACESA